MSGGTPFGGGQVENLPRSKEQVMKQGAWFAIIGSWFLSFVRGVQGDASPPVPGLSPNALRSSCVRAHEVCARSG